MEIKLENKNQKQKKKVENQKKKIFFFKKFAKYKEIKEKKIPKFLCKKTYNSIFKITLIVPIY